ncbi:MAG: hypothetical protein ACE5DM_03810 [Candidatus Nanoarchaeia archaeon]
MRPAKFLPVAFVDKLHDDDPVVLLPGTWVGLLNTGTTFGVNNGTAQVTAEKSARALVPSSTNPYKVVYSSDDVTFGTPDLDSHASTAAGVSAAGTSTGVVNSFREGVRPIGVVSAPVYSSSLTDKYNNYTRDLTPSLLCGNYNIVIPAITPNEKLIEPGDRVVIDTPTGADGTISYDETGLWSPQSVGSNGTNVVGRLRKVDYAEVTTGAAALQDQGEYIVGRCIHKWTVARGTITEGTLLSADIDNLSGQDSNHGYTTLNRVQTVPGLGLAGSATKGIPAMFKHARADGQGYYYALEIRVDL